MRTLLDILGRPEQTARSVSASLHMHQHAADSAPIAPQGLLHGHWSHNRKVRARRQRRMPIEMWLARQRHHIRIHKRLPFQLA